MSTRTDFQKRFIYFYLKGRFRKKGSRKIFHLLVHSPRWLQKPELRSSEAMSKEPPLGLSCGFRDPRIWPSSTASQVGSWMESGAGGTQTWLVGRGLACWTNRPVPCPLPKSWLWMLKALWCCLVEHCVFHIHVADPRPVSWANHWAPWCSLLPSDMYAYVGIS